MARFSDSAIFMACSATKSGEPGPPHRLYRGPMWLTLKAHLGALNMGDVWVLSAGFGFINALHWIQPYEARLTPEIAGRLIERGVDAVNDHCGRIPELGGGCSALDAFWPYAHRQQPPRQRILVAAGSEYRRVLDHYISQFQSAGCIAADANITHTRGGIGEQRRQLREWLTAPSPQPRSQRASTQESTHAENRQTDAAREDAQRIHGRLA